MMRKLSDILDDIRVFRPEQDADSGLRWNGLFVLIEELGTDESLRNAEAELLAVFEAAWNGAVSPDDLSRLNNTAVTDDVVLAASQRLLFSRSGPGQAYPHWAALGIICSARPHLLEKRLEIAVDRVFYYHHATSVEAVLSFAAGETSAPYLQSKCTPAGLDWLRNELPRHKELIEQYLRQFALTLES